MNRRQFASAALVGLTAKAGRPITGGFADTGLPVGHLLRDKALRANPTETQRVPLVIVGSGMAGLSAAWRLNKRGFSDFVILELESQAGGNSRWGQNDISAYPWAAHYLPVPDKGNPLVHELCEELGLLKDGRWEERWLCHSPQERLFLHGRWQDSLEPTVGATRKDIEQYRQFEERVQEYRDSRRFTIPMDQGLAEKDAGLDRMTMSAWLQQQGLDSPYLNWYVDYCCRDDYGALAGETSAWAGIHYHASRAPEDKGPLTWPEGNGWILKQLMARLGKYVRTAEPAVRMEQAGTGWRVTTPRTKYEAQVVIFAAPMFLAGYLMSPPPPKWPLDYSPWLTANLSLDRWPKEKGSEPAWDNVIYDSPGLGYVVATHQNVARQQPRTVWTYYWAMAVDPPVLNRRLLLERQDWNWWCDAILADLERAHPDIRQCVTRVDIFRMGHAMARPAPGAIFDTERRRRAAQDGSLLYAHADLSGFSIFEESQYRGVQAAERALRRLGRPR
jgi:glycine/D-amino acid oxidase-like deaminating enzyme